LTKIETLNIILNMEDFYGYLIIFLHSHIPYVLSHGKWPHGEVWLNEASAESYIPILDTLYSLVEEGYSPNIVIGITPVLGEQLKDERFKKSFLEYLDMKIEASEKDEEEFKNINNYSLQNLARMWQKFYINVKENFLNKYNSDIIGAFKKLQDENHIEIITSAATHSYLPLLSSDKSIEFQLKLGIESYKRNFQIDPAGIWLPECGYRPKGFWKNPLEEKSEPIFRRGIEDFLREIKIKYFIVDTHLLTGGKTSGLYHARFEMPLEIKNYQEIDYKKNVYETYLVNEDVTVFVRDPHTGIQVWSGEHGYPGDFNYLEFHKKKFPGGNRYWRITGAKVDLGEKKEYVKTEAEKRVIVHASHFLELVKKVLEKNYRETKKQTLICAPYDTELFGHWWFEGCDFLYHFIKQINKEKRIKMVTAKEYLRENPASVFISLPEGSWGAGGKHQMWLNEETKWSYKLIYQAEKEMEEILKFFKEKIDKTENEILTQILREFALLISSDWQFLISTKTAQDYAKKRIEEHFENFRRLKKILETQKEKEFSEEDKKFLEYCLKKDKIFEKIMV
jgi:1,4-alpha-glucan branching enzyme